MNGKSLDIKKENIEALKKIIPEVFTETKIDWEKLKAAIGEDIEFKNERYVLNWAGKSDAFRVLQSPTTATLMPDKGESVNFNTTENIFIEGENLEVLKVLQKSYFGKIKMIYIDPPYNTGNDNFIYPDKFSETKEEYLSRIGDKDETGYLTREGLFRKNSKDSGHYHSNWLSMMYPRLFLARNLLRDDGVIFVSIDDNEVHNLRLLMNEVFGEENFVASIIWQHSIQPKGYTDKFSVHHNYNLCYSKSDKFNLKPLERTKEHNKNYSNPDNDPNGPWRKGDVRNALFRKNLIYDIHTPSGKIIKPPKNGWRWSKETINNKIKTGEIIFNKDESNIIRKIYLNKLEGRTPETIWFGKEVGTTREGINELKELFVNSPFDTSKPSGLIKRMLELSSSSNDDIILDFFAGSATTAEAIYIKNAEDKINRKYILIQIDEKIDENTPAGINADSYKLKTIAEIGKERIRRVIKKIKKEQDGKLDLDGNFEKQDLGFKVFKLQESNFKIWRTKIENEEQLVEQLQQHLEPLDENAKIEDVLYELLLKSGVSLTAKIEEKNGFYLVNDTEIALILEKVDKEIIKTVIDAKPQKVITIDRLFNNNDQLKTNTALQMKDAGIEFKVV
jgi:adenine-specific DNA-methyltransferase